MVAMNSAAQARGTARAFLTGRNMSVISFILLAGVFFIYVEIGAGGMAYVATLAEPGIGLRDRMRHGRPGEVAGRVGRGGSRRGVQKTLRIGDIVLANR